MRVQAAGARWDFWCITDEHDIGYLLPLNGNFSRIERQTGRRLSFGRGEMLGGCRGPGIEPSELDGALAKLSGRRAGA